jgi:cysteine desulfurase
MRDERYIESAAPKATFCQMTSTPPKFEPIDLDHAATTPLLPAAREAMLEGLALWANPSSPHRQGRVARAALEEARARIKAALGWDGELVFTSGASEALAIALTRCCLPLTAVSAVEHEAVLRHAGEARKLAVDTEGLVAESVPGGLVAIQHVNNETGVIQPLERLAAQVRAAGGLLLADCAQSAGKLALPDADFIAACGHKLGGPPGIGVLLVRDLATLEPVGGQEKGYRRGTQDVPAAAAFAAALAAHPYDMDRLAGLRRRLEEGVKQSGGLVIAEDSPRIATIGAVALPGTSSASLLAQMDLAGIAVSAGSACSSGKMKKSVVLEAMDVPEEIAASFLRLSFGPATSEADIDGFLAQWREIAARASPKFEAA